MCHNISMRNLRLVPSGEHGESDAGAGLEAWLGSAGQEGDAPKPWVFSGEGIALKFSVYSSDPVALVTASDVQDGFDQSWEQEGKRTVVYAPLSTMREGAENTGSALAFLWRGGNVYPYNVVADNTQAGRQAEPANQDEKGRHLPLKESGCIDLEGKDGERWLQVLVIADDYNGDFLDRDANTGAGGMPPSQAALVASILEAVGEASQELNRQLPPKARVLGGLVGF